MSGRSNRSAWWPCDHGGAPGANPMVGGPAALRHRRRIAGKHVQRERRAGYLEGFHGRAAPLAKQILSLPRDDRESDVEGVFDVDHAGDRDWLDAVVRLLDGQL